MELVPLVLPSTICLFCLGDDELISQARIVSFSRIDSLRRHMDDIHLSHYDPEVPLYALTRHVTSPFRVSITSRSMLLPCITYSCRSETWVGCPLGITSMQDIETYVSVKIVGLVASWAFGACLK